MSNSPTSAFKGGAALGLVFVVFWLQWLPWNRLTAVLVGIVFLVAVGSFYLLQRSSWTAKVHLGLKFLACFFASWVSSAAALLILHFLTLK
ncbi:MAG: hypothetical protein ABMA26_24595 [Limisphaerales bacterium]